MSYDCIVVGTGGIGSAALYHLARRGANVLGIDRFPPGHDRGSSHGQTRMIRLAYFEHPDYVPLLRRAYELWRELETEHGAPLYRETGALQVGPPDGVVVPGVLRAAREHGLAIDEVARGAIAGLDWPDSMQAVFERRAGLLSVEECVRAHAALAQQHGAELRIGESVTGWRADGAGVSVETDKGTVRAARLVLAPGAWAASLLGDIGVPFRVLRKSLHWYATDAPHHAIDHGLPAFYFELPNGHFYGFPKVDARGLKLAEHTGGREITDPLATSRDPRPEDQSRIEAFLDSHVPGASRTRTHHEICFYTMTPDQHFVVDHHPRHHQIAFAAGLSGHGFKFASVLGEILAELTLNGRTNLLADFLRASRFGKSTTGPQSNTET
ncbi:MAG: N-methyl-L-tryptophan oxidase [Planctomycetota bacterium]